MFVLPVMPAALRSAGYLLGARNLGGAGSPLAALIWAPILFLISHALSDEEDPWDDAKDLERVIAYHIRSLPGVGVGTGFLYDLLALFISLFSEDEEFFPQKSKSLIGYGLPDGVFRDLNKAIAQPVLESILEEDE